MNFAIQNGTIKYIKKKQYNYHVFIDSTQTKTCIKRTLIKIERQVCLFTFKIA